MPTVSEIEQALFRLAPKELAMAWDNVGHLEGNPKQSVQRLLVALDVTEAVVSEAEQKGCQLIVSHHPLRRSCNPCGRTAIWGICCEDWSRQIFPLYPCIQIWILPPVA